MFILLYNWKDDDSRKPLLLSGARQIGKTFIVKEFGQAEFVNIVNINFERNPEYKEIYCNF
ncbi:MAG: hypothetical protein B6I20_14250 [Bacteroidetes bacterium 4572_117]|nr:MAG: hypothetical protein B6I20_14250 [Bacteroidetes bacterium 4572_117]